MRLGFFVLVAGMLVPAVGFPCQIVDKAAGEITFDDTPDCLEVALRHGLSENFELVFSNNCDEPVMISPIDGSCDPCDEAVELLADESVAMFVGGEPTTTPVEVVSAYAWSISDGAESGEVEVAASAWLYEGGACGDQGCGGCSGASVGSGANDLGWLLGLTVTFLAFTRRRQIATQDAR